MIIQSHTTNLCHFRESYKKKSTVEWRFKSSVVKTVDILGKREREREGDKKELANTHIARFNALFLFSLGQVGLSTMVVLVIPSIGTLVVWVNVIPYFSRLERGRNAISKPQVRINVESNESETIWETNEKLCKWELSFFCRATRFALAWFAVGFYQCFCCCSVLFFRLQAKDIFGIWNAGWMDRWPAEWMALLWLSILLLFAIVIVSS